MVTARAASSHCAKRCRGLGDLTVVAPDRNRSGASNSLTLEMPLRVEKAEADVYFVQGTPTDCVHLAISGLFPFEPDMVVSGINDGSNLGDDVLYSGTVAAATEGRLSRQTRGGVLAATPMACAATQRVTSRPARILPGRSSNDWSRHRWDAPRSST